VATVLFVFTLPLVYFTPIYEWSLRYGAVHAWLHIHLFRGRAVRRGDHRPRPPSPHRQPPARLGLVMSTVPLHAFLGVALLSSTTVIAGRWYAGSGGSGARRRCRTTHRRGDPVGRR
jgi:putative copper resistance protein D